MKKIVLLSGICLCCFFSVFAQQKSHFTYTVKKGESIRKIARRFDVKTKEIYRLNPGLGKRPKVNTVVLLPSVSFKEGSVRIASFQSHIVQPKETLYGIAKKYHISVASLIELNPFIKKEGLKLGMVVRIPEVKLISKEALLKKELESWAEQYVLHTVVKGDTYYNLTRHYNVTKEQLKLLNPALYEGIKLGMVLKIKEKINFDKLAELDSITQPVFKDSLISGKMLNVALLLPFKFSKNDTLTKEQLFSSKGNLVNIVTDFYLGAAIAVDSLKNQGLSVDVKVYDTENEKDCILDLFDSKKLEGTDVVFGPVYSRHADLVASRLKDVPIIFPFYSSRQDFFLSNNLVKTATDTHLYQKVIMNHFKATHKDEHVLIVGDEKIDSKLKMLDFSKQIQNNDSVNKIRFLQPENGYIDKERFVAAVDTMAVNWVLLTTNSKVVTADVVNNLKALPNSPKVKLFAFEKGSNFNKVDNNTLAKMNFTYASSRLLNDTLSKTHNFYQQYLKVNNTYPSKYAIRGFDVVYDILMRMASEENNSLVATYKKGGSVRVENTFLYDKKILWGPSFNTSVYLMKYNEDLSIQVIK